MRLSIFYTYKEECLFVCLFVRCAFSPCNSQRHQTFHGIPLDPDEGRDGAGATEGWLSRIPPSHHVYIHTEECLSVCSLCDCFL